MRSVPLFVRCAHGPLGPSFPLLFAALTGRSGHGLARHLAKILIKLPILKLPIRSASLVARLVALPL